MNELFLLEIFQLFINVLILMKFVFYISATDVVTVYVFQEPSLLSSLQDKGLTDVVLHALLIKDVSLNELCIAHL